ALVGWPMLYGVLVLGLGWVCYVRLVVWPSGSQLPLAWPALLLACCLAWLQALSWSPFPLPWLRVVAAAGVLPGVGVGALLARACEVPGGVVRGALGALTLLAYAVAVAGVARARRGEAPSWGWSISWGSGEGPRFSSAGQAQRWLEWRAHGRPFA